MKSKCKICGAPTTGFHFGVFSCRACAAFFRRALQSNKSRKTCLNGGRCTDFSGNFMPSCKSCRMKKCIRMGMLSKNLQIQQNTKIARSFEEFVGKPSLVMFTTNTAKKRNYVDVKHLVSGAYVILRNGASHLLNPNLTQLERMTFGVTFSSGKSEYIGVVCQESFSKVWEFDLFSTAKWLTHMEAFSALPLIIQMQLLQSVWHVFGRLYKTRMTAELRSKEDSKRVHVSDKYYVDMDKCEYDMSWLTNYPFEQIHSFLFGAGEDNCETGAERIIDSVTKLDLTKVELTFLTAQACFQYASNRYSGTEMSEICDRFSTILSDDLHRYYMRDDNVNKNYAGRLTQMLKISQYIQKLIRLHREKAIIARTFDIFIADFSHPEMFVDTGI